jgi:hypothetical protein
MGERDIGRLLRGMEPELHSAAYGFALWPGGALPFAPFATVAEVEGLTVVAPLDVLAGVRLASEPWGRISLTIHSDLAAVGLTAALSAALAREGISCNVIAGLHHDHLFVPWDRRGDALRALEALAHA